VATNKSTFTVIHISHHTSQIYLVPDDSGIRGVFNTKLYVIKSGFIWFYLATPVSSTKKTDRMDVTEILSKVLSNSHNPRVWIQMIFSLIK
jgi:hypothetical protein